MTTIPAWLMDVASDHLVDTDDPESYQSRLRGLCASLTALEADVRAVAPSPAQGPLPEAAMAISRASAAISGAAHDLELIGQALILAGMGLDP